MAEIKKVNFIAILTEHDHDIASWDVVVEGGAPNESQATALATKLNGREKEVEALTQERDKLRAACQSAIEGIESDIESPNQKTPEGNLLSAALTAVRDGEGQS